MAGDNNVVRLGEGADVVLQANMGKVEQIVMAQAARMTVADVLQDVDDNFLFYKGDSPCHPLAMWGCEVCDALTLFFIGHAFTKPYDDPERSQFDQRQFWVCLECGTADFIWGDNERKEHYVPSSAYRGRG